MIYLTLLLLGLSIGAGFLVVLLIGDKKEARREAERKAQQEQMTQAGQPVEGAWPPPPTAPALPPFALPTSALPTSARPPAPRRTTNRQMVSTFFLVRNCAIGVVILAYIVYSCVPHMGFGWVLLATALAFGVVWGGIMLVKKRS